MAATAFLPVKCPVCDERVDVPVKVRSSHRSETEETHVWELSPDGGPLNQHLNEKHPNH